MLSRYHLVLAYLVSGSMYDQDQAYEGVIYLDIPGAERAGHCLPFNVLEALRRA